MGEHEGHAAPQGDPPPNSVALGLRYAGIIVLFLLATLAVGVVADFAAPQVFPERIQEKFDYFADHKDEYDVVFLGSSLVKMHIDPALFDAELAARGLEIKSFNFGIGGMGFHEENVLLREILAIKPARLKWVVIDLAMFFERPYPKERFMTDRYLWWHTPSETVSAMGRTRQSARMTDIEKRVYLSAHARHAALRQLHVGQGPALLERLLGLRPPVSAESIHLRREGFVPSAHRPLDADAYAELVAAYEQLRAGPQAFTSTDIAALQRQEELVRGHDAQPVYMTLPSMIVPEVKARAALERGHISDLLAYDDPAEYPWLYDATNRTDEEHLKPAVAARFTKVVAGDFADYLGRPQ